MAPCVTPRTSACQSESRPGCSPTRSAASTIASVSTAAAAPNTIPRERTVSERCSSWVASRTGCTRSSAATSRTICVASARSVAARSAAKAATSDRATVRLRLTPQKREFFVLFNDAAANAREIARLLVELLQEWPANRSRLADIRELEHEGDRLTHAVIDLLNRTFVTPFDRDDMYRLASVIDDVCDHVDEAADNIDAYEVVDVPPKALEQAQVIHRAASRLAEAVELLDGYRDSRRQLVALRELEDEGDHLSREAIADLFRDGADPLAIIRWKDIHEHLEEAVDACENAADVLEAILVKNR